MQKIERLILCSPKKTLDEIEEFNIGEYQAYHWSDKYTKSYGVSIFIKDQLIDITGDININIMCKIAESIHIHK